MSVALVILGVLVGLLVGGGVYLWAERARLATEVAETKRELDACVRNQIRASEEIAKLRDKVGKLSVQAGLERS